MPLSNRTTATFARLLAAQTNSRNLRKYVKTP